MQHDKAARGGGSASARRAAEEGSLMGGGAPVPGDTLAGKTTAPPPPAQAHETVASGMAAAVAAYASSSRSGSRGGQPRWDTRGSARAQSATYRRSDAAAAAAARLAQEYIGYEPVTGVATSAMSLAGAAVSGSSAPPAQSGSRLTSRGSAGERGVSRASVDDSLLGGASSNALGWPAHDEAGIAGGSRSGTRGSVLGDGRGPSKRTAASARLPTSHMRLRQQLDAARPPTRQRNAFPTFSSDLELLRDMWHSSRAQLPRVDEEHVDVTPPSSTVAGSGGSGSSSAPSSRPGTAGERIGGRSGARGSSGACDSPRHLHADFVVMDGAQGLTAGGDGLEGSAAMFPVDAETAVNSYAADPSAGRRAMFYMRELRLARQHRVRMEASFGAGAQASAAPAWQTLMPRTIPESRAFDAPRRPLTGAASVDGDDLGGPYEGVVMEEGEEEEEVEEEEGGEESRIRGAASGRSLDEAASVYAPAVPAVIHQAVHRGTAARGARIVSNVSNVPGSWAHMVDQPPLPRQGITTPAFTSAQTAHRAVSSGSVLSAGSNDDRDTLSASTLTASTSSMRTPAFTPHHAAAVRTRGAAASALFGGRASVDTAGGRMPRSAGGMSVRTAPSHSYGSIDDGFADIPVSLNVPIVVSGRPPIRPASVAQTRREMDARLLTPAGPTARAADVVPVGSSLPQPGSRGARAAAAHASVHIRGAPAEVHMPTSALGTRSSSAAGARAEAAARMHELLRGTTASGSSSGSRPALVTTAPSLVPPHSPIRTPRTAGSARRIGVKDSAASPSKLDEAVLSPGGSPFIYEDTDVKEGLEEEAEGNHAYVETDLHMEDTALDTEFLSLFANGKVGASGPPT